MKSKHTRKQRFKDLMRNRNTLEKGLTFKQIFYEVYPEIAEDEKYLGQNWGHLSFDDPIFWKIAYLKRMMKKIRKQDDDFRWLSPSKPIKTGNKWGYPPYSEYRYINIKASETPDLLTEINKYWHKRITAIAQGYRRTRETLQALMEATSTPEGETKLKIQQDAFLFEIEERITTPLQLDKIVDELKREGRIPNRAYKQNVDYRYLIDVLKKEIVNEDSLANIFRSLPPSSSSDERSARKKEVRRLVKDTIEAYHNRHIKTELAKNTKIEEFI